MMIYFPFARTSARMIIECAIERFFRALPTSNAFMLTVNL